MLQTSAIRNLPEVPTFPEGGLPLPSDMSGWWALIAPEGVPDAILERLNAETVRVLELPEVRESLSSKGITATPSTHAQAVDYQREQFGVWKRMVEELNLRQQ